MDDKLISIIVPVFNSERFLSACLDSILSQDYHNIEVIVINDGSSDFSLKIAETYSLKDNRISVYTQQNLGLSQARNKALDVMTGDYITFVDADDILLPDALKTLMKVLEKENADIVEGKTIKGKLITTSRTNVQIDIKTFNSQGALSDMLYQKLLLPSVCGKLFRKRMFNELRFEEGILYEDLNLIYKLLDKCEKIVWINFPVYFYRNTEGSILNSWKLQRLDVLKVTENIENYISLKYPDLIHAAQNRRLSANFNIFALCSKYGEHEHAKKCWDLIKDRRKNVLFNPHVRIKNKGGVILSYFGKNIFSLIARKVYR